MMSPEKTARLIERHPELLAVPPDTVIAQRGIECGDGWFGLIDDAFTAIEAHCESNGLPVPAITQVKEKFGKLRVYVKPWDKGIASILDTAERKSAEICEQCGRPGRLVATPYLHSSCGEHTPPTAELMRR